MINRKGEAGFSYLDVLVAVMILMVGVLALTAAITGAVVRSREGGALLTAKQLATSSLESILSARDLETFGWNSVGNTDGSATAISGETPLGVFLAARHAIKADPGVDEIVGTGDDSGSVTSGYERLIRITNTDATGRARRIEVTIFYQGTGSWRQEKIATIITDYVLE